MIERIHGFYSILHTDDEVLAHDLVRPIAAGGCGSQVLQVRIKPETPVTTAELLRISRMARRVCHEHGALCIIDDRLDVALAVGADGVHLGQHDLPLADARALVQHLDRPFLIGITTNDDEQARIAVAGGADYLGFGPVFHTTTKRNPDPVRGLEGLRSVVTAAGGLPVVAIGGIKPEHAADIAATGAVSACIISGVNLAADRAAAGVRVGAAFDRA